MEKINPERVFEYFDKITKIPRGSGNMEKISQYCVDFAKQHSLKVVCDDVKNVIIYKDGTKGYEMSEPVILQGHLDMVCQKEADCDIDFEKDGLKTYIDGDFIKAEGTTLGADNGIAVAMILSILESNDISHPPIEAVFTVDEETSMEGAGALDTSILKGKRMINIDAEEPETLTVSCAGGSNVEITVPANREIKEGTKVEISLKNLRGGHSGVMIHHGITNANLLMGKVLDKAKEISNISVISVNGGDKGNAIPTYCTAEIVCENINDFKEKFVSYMEIIKEEVIKKEPDFEYEIKVLDEGKLNVIDNNALEKLMFVLLNAPNGVVAMSKEIENLVETSLNLGILKTEEDEITFLFTLRSNKKHSLKDLEDDLISMCQSAGCVEKASGHYPPWEFKENSALQRIYKETYKEMFGKEPLVVAIHAGLECGMFSDKIEDIDAIAIGPLMYDVHTVNERLSISSTKEMYGLIVSLLKNLK